MKRTLLGYLSILVFLALICVFPTQQISGYIADIATPTATATAPTRFPTISPQNASRLSIKYSLEARGSDQIYQVSWLPDGKTLAVRTVADDVHRVWLYSTNPLQAHPRQLEGNGIFSPDGTMWVSRKGGGYEDTTINLVDVANGRLQTVLTGVSGMMIFSPDSRTLVTGDFGLKFWETKTGKVIWEIPVDQVGQATGLDFSPDGKIFAIGNSSGEVILWDVNQKRKLVETHEHGNNVRVRFSPDGKYLLSTSIDRSAMVWDAQTLKRVDAVQGVSDTINGEFSNDSSLIALNDVAGGETRMISQLQVWDFKAQYARSTFKLLDKSYYILISGNSKFRSDGTMLAFWTSNEAFFLINPITGKLLYTLQGHIDFVEHVRFSPDGNLLISADKNGELIVWDTATGKKIINLKGKPLEDILFSPDGTMLIAAYQDGSLHVWGVD